MEKISLLLGSNKNMDLLTIIVYLTVTLILTTLIFTVYKLTYSGVAYSKNFNTSIVLTGMVTAIVMMVIGNNLALSLGMVGALSIVRFRAAIKEPKDISYLFWSIAVGLAVGTGAIQIGVAGTIFMTFTILLYHFGFGKKQDVYLLVIKGGSFNQEEIRTVIKKNVKAFRLRMKNTKKDSAELIYEVRLKGNDESVLVEELYANEGIQQVNIVTYNGSINE